jgi:predicted anti-sigma-YlaC factor YlaD
METVMTKSRKPLSPQEQLRNVYASLADDVVEGHLEVDHATRKRASQLAREVLAKATSAGEHSASPPEELSQEEWTKRSKRPDSTKGRKK